MNTYNPKPNSGSSLLFLLLMFVACFTFFYIFIAVIGLLTKQLDVLTNPTNIEGDGIYLYYFILGMSSIATFLLPAYFLQLREKNKVQYFPNNSSQTLFLSAGIVFLIMISFSPLMSLIGEWNQNIKLPDSFAAVENWMREMEDKAALTTKNIVMTTSVSQLLINILVIAILPAIGEEFFFRGALQNIILRAVRNTHLAIWITAIIFSAIHFQFFGFFPRVLLGAFFGYFFIWTKNIWIPIFAHFINNTVVTLVAFYYSSQGKTYEELMKDDPMHFSIYILSFFATTLLIYYLRKITVQKSNNIWKKIG